MNRYFEFGARGSTEIDSAEHEFRENQLRTAELGTPSTSGGGMPFKTASK